MKPAALIKKQDKILRKFGVGIGTVYKRVTTTTGGDPLIGRPGSVSSTDTKLDPQPFYQRAGRTSISGERLPQKPVLTATRALTADQAIFIVSPSAMTLADIENPNVVLVVKYSGGNSEIFHIEDYNPHTLGSEGEVVMFIVYARSVKRD